eukprot:350480-Chlamydomonas_euryale.AAC.1
MTFSRLDFISPRPFPALTPYPRLSLTPRPRPPPCPALPPPGLTYSAPDPTPPHTSPHPPTPQVTCVTRAHLAADASGSDPGAKRVQPRVSQPGAVQLTVCEPGLSDVNKLVCWSQPRAATSVCTSDGACNFAYALSSTPMVGSVSPASGQGGAAFTVSGMNFAMNIAEVELHDAHGGVRQCAGVSNVDGSTITCTLPSLPPGPHAVTLVRANGERSVVSAQHLAHTAGAASAGAAVYHARPFMVEVSGNVGSLAGGGELVLTSNATGAGLTTGFDVISDAANRVAIGGVLPCDVVPGSVTATSLRCVAPALVGRVLARHFSLSAVRATPDADLLARMTPDAVTLERSAQRSYGSGAPAAGVEADYFATMFTWYLPLDVTANYTFYPSADDTVQ